MNHRMKTKKTTGIMRLHVTSVCADILCKYVNVDGESSSRWEDEKATVGPVRVTLTFEFSRIVRELPCRT